MSPETESYGADGLSPAHPPTRPHGQPPTTITQGDISLSSLITPDQICARLPREWASKTLAELRQEAAVEPTGTLYESFREENGRRYMLLICVTRRDHIAIFERAFFLGEKAAPVDWSTITLAEIFQRAVAGEGFTFECQRDEAGQRSSLFVCSTEPRSMMRLQILFSLPA